MLVSIKIQGVVVKISRFGFYLAFLKALCKVSYIAGNFVPGMFRSFLQFEEFF